jgi:hypothetical protein
MMSQNDVRVSWKPGVLIGLGAAAASTLTLFVIAALSDRGLHLLTDAGMGGFSTLLRAITGMSPALSYLIGHTAMYLLAGVGGLALARLLDRVPAFITGLVLLGIVIEMGFLVFTTESGTMGRFDESTWRALLIAHAVGDLTFVLGLVRVLPGLRHLLVHGYDD